MERRKIIFVICLLLVLLIHSACGTRDNTTQIETLSSSNQLVLYRDPMLASQLDSAVAAYKQQYPEVEVLYRDFGELTDPEATTQYTDILRSELAAGKGPDLIVASPDTISIDFSKTIDNGVFLNLYPFLQRDREISENDYVNNWGSVGLQNEKKYFVVLSYTTKVLYADKSVLQRCAPSIDTDNGINAFANTMIAWLNTENADVSFWNLPSGYGLSTVLPWTGAELIDYASREVVLDDTFRVSMEMYKALYDLDQEDNESGWIGKTVGEDGRDASLGEFLFLCGFMLDDITEFRAMNREERVMKPFPNVSGKCIAVPDQVACINSTSENTENAYNFLKILLSESIQRKMLYYPVSLEAIENRLRENGKAIYVDSMGNTLTTTLFTEEADTFMALTTGDLEWHMPVPYGVYDIVWSTMKPFICDEKSYEDCVNELRNRLQIYVNE